MLLLTQAQQSPELIYSSQGKYVTVRSPNLPRLPPPCRLPAGVSEVAALLTFKKALTIPPTVAEFFATWDETATSPCNFTGVNCNNTNSGGSSVTGIFVEVLGVSAASVPFDVLCTSLPSLVTLSLPSNALAGGIDGVVGCTGLRELDLAFNRFSGDVPDLSPLTNLNVSHNSFTGEVPAEFSEFKNLVILSSLYNNNLTGELPRKLGSVSDLENVDVWTNSLSGPIQPHMCKRGALRQLFMPENNFSGEIPATYANCTTLELYGVKDNSMSGDVPEGLWALPIPQCPSH
uniref:Leucine-rich repeat-containing N-terminal plant-type domain-containing protein n=1 Tax=Leersia perrieri TaxID=77586 RepID=A0A0D9WYM4_9ORYZ